MVRMVPCPNVDCGGEHPLGEVCPLVAEKKRAARIDGDPDAWLLEKVGGDVKRAEAGLAIFAEYIKRGGRKVFKGTGVRARKYSTEAMTEYQRRRRARIREMKA